MRSKLLLLLVLAGCATSRPRPTPPIEPTLPEDTTFVAPDVSTLEGWQDPDVEKGAPVPLGGSRSAMLLARRIGDHHEVVLAVGRADGTIAQLLPVARVEVGGKKRDVVSSLARFPLGRRDTLRADVRVFESAPPRFFAVKTILFAVGAEGAEAILDRLSESGDDVRDRRAVLLARDLDGDGDSELVVEEKESGQAQPRTLVYRRGPDGKLVTRERSMFE